MTTSPRTRIRRPLLLTALSLLLFYWLLPRLVSAWLPGILAPYGFDDLHIALAPPGLRASGVDSVDFVWNGPDGLRLKFRTQSARYVYADDAVVADDAELELLAYPVSKNEGPSEPLSAWPLLPVRGLLVRNLKVTFPVADKVRSTKGRLAAAILPDGTGKLVLYVSEGLPDNLPGRFELRIAPDATLFASAGLANGKTTTFYAETSLDAPPAKAPPFHLRVAGNLKPFYRWLEREVPEQAQIKAEFTGQLPSRYDLDGWLTQMSAKGEFGLDAVNWQLPWGLAKQFHGTGKLDYQKGKGTLEADSTKVDAVGLRLPAFRLKSRFDRTPEQITATGTLASTPVSAQLSLKYTPANRTGHLQWRKLDARLADLLALAGEYLPEAGAAQVSSGTAQGEGMLDWTQGNKGFVFKPAMHLRIQDLSGSFQALSWQGGNADLQLTSLSPLQAEASLALARLPIAVGTELTQLRARLRASGRVETPTLDVEAAQTELLGGRARIAALRYTPGTALTLPVEVENLDLARLLQVVGQPGLSGTGRISGHLPVRWDKGQLSLDEDAMLTADGSGAIRYVPAGADALAQSNQGSNIAMQALENFQFKRLQAGLSYSPFGDYGIKLALEGANPALYNGYPIAFNLNLEGHLPDLLRASLFSGDFSENLLKEVQRQEHQLPH